MRWNTLDEFTEFASWFGQTREHFGSDVIKDLENENFYSSGNAVCVCVRYTLRSPNEWIRLAYGQFFKHHITLDSMHLSLGISDDLASVVGSSCLCTTGKKHNYLFKGYLFNPHWNQLVMNACS